jgi:hypothetical protein
MPWLGKRLRSFLSLKFARYPLRAGKLFGNFPEFFSHRKVCGLLSDKGWCHGTLHFIESIGTIVCLPLSLWAMWRQIVLAAHRRQPNG